MYQKLQIDVQLTEETEYYIDEYVTYLNGEGRRTVDDYYQMELDSCLRYELREGHISREQYAALSDFYVHDGVKRQK